MEKSFRRGLCVRVRVRVCACVRVYVCVRALNEESSLAADQSSFAKLISTVVSRW